MIDTYITILVETGKLFPNFCEFLTISAKTGRMIFATATLEVNSVTVSANRHTISSIVNGSINCKAVSAFPRIEESLELVLPAEMANPPPKTKIKLQCIF